MAKKIITEKRNYQRMFNRMNGVSGLISGSLMMCEELAYVECNDDNAYVNLSKGAFRILAFALDGAFDTLQIIEGDFTKATGAKYPYQMTEEERRDYRGDNCYTALTYSEINQKREDALKEERGTMQTSENKADYELHQLLLEKVMMLSKEDATALDTFVSTLTSLRNQESPQDNSQIT